jgi:ABC-2 type transport system permease protein
MTAPAYVAAGPRPPSTAQVLARTCAAEWSRLWTVKATWWFLVAAAVTMIGIGAALGLEVADDPATEGKPPAWLAGSIAAMPAQFAFLALALLAVTADYATGGIIPTLQWTPRRGVLLAARTVVPVAVVTALGVLLAVASSLAAWAASGRLELPRDEGLTILGWVAVVLAAGATMTVGLGFLFRSTAGGLVSVFLLMLVLPLLLPIFGLDWLNSFAVLLPGSGAILLLVDESVTDMSTNEAVTVLVGWAVLALLLGAVRLIRADADQ